MLSVITSPVFLKIYKKMTAACSYVFTLADYIRTFPSSVVISCSARFSFSLYSASSFCMSPATVHTANVRKQRISQGGNNNTLLLLLTIWSQKVLDVSSTNLPTDRALFHTPTTRLATEALLPPSHVCGTASQHITYYLQQFQA